MSDRIAEWSWSATPVARIASTFMVGAFLSGCAPTGNSSLTVFADPGKYQFSSCESLVTSARLWRTKRRSFGS